MEEKNKKVASDFSKLRIGTKSLNDILIDMTETQRASKNVSDKEAVLRDIDNLNIDEMRKTSEYYYRTNGIYGRLCRYMAYLYNYDWWVSAYINEEKAKDKAIKDYHLCLNYLDNSNIKKILGDAALKVIIYGAYYGYKIELDNKFIIQELPVKYCRSRFISPLGTPAIEFNVRYFDENFRDTEQKIRALKIFPKDIRDGYIKYKENKLPQESGDTAGWHMLDYNNCVAFTLNNGGLPPFISVIPALIDLEIAQGLDRKRLEQQLLKIIIQRMPVDKNGDLIFDVEESRQLHLNAMAMIGASPGVKVLTTFADTEVEELASSSASNAADDSLKRILDNVFNQAGVSQMQFNTDGNLALEKSTLNDEATIRNLIQQFEIFLNTTIEKFNKNRKRYSFRLQILNTTIYNFKEMSKLYKEQTQIGFSKFLPQIALGQSQSSILANAYFENEVLKLSELFVPPASSNTVSAKASNSEEGAGRPKKADDEKAEKTLQNQEAM